MSAPGNGERAALAEAERARFRAPTARLDYARLFRAALAAALARHGLALVAAHFDANPATPAWSISTYDAAGVHGTERAGVVETMAYEPHDVDAWPSHARRVARHVASLVAAARGGAVLELERV